MFCFYFYQTLRVVPHGTKGTGPRFVMRPAYLRSQFRNNTNTVSTLVLLIYLLQVLCTRYAGIAHHRALQTSGRGWADSKAVHRMECSRARTLCWRSLSAGAAARSVLYCQYREVCSPTRPSANKPTNYQQRTPRSCVRVVFIAGDTLRQQPIGAGPMTLLQLCGLMEFRVLQWCHPMLASTRRTSCCTRIITLYGTRKWIQARTFPSPS